jgi:hypothetical protein
MHKSGTTLISQILHNSGINMVEDPDSGVSYDQGNKFERLKVLSLNMDVLRVTDHEILSLPKPKSMTLQDQQRNLMQEIIEECNSRYSSWGFKEPRTTLTYPLWKDELPTHRIVGAYRSPEEVWPRFRWQGWRRRYVNPYRAWQFVSRWLEHNQSLVKYLRDTTMDFILIDYRRLMSSNDELQRLEQFVGCKLQDMRRNALYREREPNSDFLLTAASKLAKLTLGQTVKEVMSDLEALRSDH